MVFLILYEEGEFSSFCSTPVAIYEKYKDACFYIASTIETKKQSDYISGLNGNWSREHGKYVIWEMNLNDSTNDSSSTYDYDESIEYKTIIESQKYIKFVEELTKNNEILLIEANKENEKRKKKREEEFKARSELNAQRIKDIIIERNKKFAEDYFKNNEHSDASHGEIIDKISKEALYTNNKDLIEWVLQNR